MTLDQILENLVSKYPYIKYVAVLDEHARLESSAGNWDDPMGLEVASLMLDSRDKLWNSLNEDIRRICVTTNQGYLYLIEFDCDSTYFFLAKADNSQRVGVMENLIDRTVKDIKDLLMAESDPIINPTIPESNGTPPEDDFIVNLSNHKPSGTARGRNIIE